MPATATKNNSSEVSVEVVPSLACTYTKPEIKSNNDSWVGQGNSSVGLFNNRYKGADTACADTALNHSELKKKKRNQARASRRIKERLVEKNSVENDIEEFFPVADENALSLECNSAPSIDLPSEYCTEIITNQPTTWKNDCEDAKPLSGPSGFCLREQSKH